MWNLKQKWCLRLLAGLKLKLIMSVRRTLKSSAESLRPADRRHLQQAVTLALLHCRTRRVLSYSRSPINANRKHPPYRWLSNVSTVKNQLWTGVHTLVPIRPYRECDKTQLWTKFRHIPFLFSGADDCCFRRKSLFLVIVFIVLLQTSWMVLPWRRFWTSILR